MCFVEVVTLTFCNGKKQLSAKEIETTRKAANNIRIHIEQIIRTLGQRYMILKGILSL